MSAPTPATGDGSPTSGYYPDPSIPGYVRYWNGASWVPGTSRPAPKTGEAMPSAPGSSASEFAPAGPAASAHTPAPMEETGPVFLDEEPFDAPSRPEPATAWQADTSRQTGFGGDRDNRVAWGGGQDPRTPPQGGGSGAPADPRRSAAPGASADPTGGALPGVRSLGPSNSGEPPVDGTVAIRAMRPGGAKQATAGTGVPAADPASPAPAGGTTARGLPQRPQTDGTTGIGAQRLGGGTPTAPAQPQAPAQRQPQPQGPIQPQQQSQRPQPQVPAHAQEPVAAPVTNGPGGGSASWAQQVHQLAGTAAEGEPVVPWKPPVNDPFLQAAQAQAAARPASLGKRFAARLIDSLLLGALVGAVAVPVVSRARTHIDEKIEAAKQSGETVTVWLVDSTTAVHLGIILGALLVLGALYEALPTATWGRTLGKKLCGLTVWDIESHEPPSFGAALRRWLVYGLLGVLAVGLLNVLWCLFDRPWRQCWHDKAAHTFVTG
ncbi:MULTISPECIES: RDD family protein [unclassified Streptomyces]|uniref:RDD family protein n=1 Tax=unclassified Streptomyces TaxID=2593676 RepID=UPI002DDAD425|nr:RDD family protein [Streptomyces sp. NBC_01750]WSB02583.1 RDD family protein [Streptomyces sp. NBC_01794]WSD33146.1 RDD family protein [Streptomyces sp. NBC_01750]